MPWEKDEHIRDYNNDKWRLNGIEKDDNRGIRYRGS